MFLLKTLFLIPHSIQTWDGRNPLKKVPIFPIPLKSHAAGICLKKSMKYAEEVVIYSV